MIESADSVHAAARRIKPIPYPIPERVEKRFWPKVNKTETCWLYFGEIPNHLNVLHRCDVRTCVNPAHLFLGTNDDNMKDMAAKNRQGYVCGERNHMAKLTADDIREIRRLRPTMSMTELAKRFGITRGYVCGIMGRRAWKHI
jgi:hypothetical protein